MALVKPAPGGRGFAWKAHLAMVLVQIINGGYLVVTKVALDVGINRVVFCAYRNLLGFAILSPIAFILDRGVRPPLTGRLLLSFLFLGLTGVLGNQLLLVIGLGYTNPTYTAAVQPSIPIFTFILAAIMGMERVNFHRKEGWIKVIGTIVCASGAVVILIYRGPVLFGNGSDHAIHGEMVTGTQSVHVIQLGSNLLKFQLSSWHFGALCLIGNCICMAAFLVVQAPVLVKYPATLSLTAYTYFFGAILIFISGLFAAGDYTDWILTKSELLAVIYSGVLTSALNYGLIAWSNKIIGPALVSLYNPLQTAMSALLSTIFIGSSIFLGSVIGGVLIICSLYLVTWARYTESKEAIAKSCEDLISEPFLQDALPRRQSSVMIP